MSFDVAAAAYDEYMGAWSSQLAPGLADLAGVRSGTRALDVGCGPGALLTELVARTGRDLVAGVDPSEPFVNAARDRHPGVDVRVASAEALPYPDRTFDAVLAQLVVHFMRDPLAGLSEMARVARSGGVVAASVWDYGGGRGPLGPFWEVAHELDAEVVGEADLPGARAGDLRTLLEAAALRDVVETALEVSRTFPDFDAWWAPFTRGVGPGGAYLASLSPDGVEMMREGCRARLPDGPVELRAVAWAAMGVA
jgi:SAM-dependent methyltransferase